MKFTSFQKQVSINKAKFLGGRTFCFIFFLEKLRGRTTLAEIIIKTT